MARPAARKPHTIVEESTEDIEAVDEITLEDLGQPDSDASTESQQAMTKEMADLMETQSESETELMVSRQQENAEKWKAALQNQWQEATNQQMELLWMTRLNQGIAEEQIAQELMTHPTTPQEMAMVQEWIMSKMRHP